MKTITQKQCGRCKLVKPVEFFGVDKSRTIGFRSYCRECERKSTAERLRRPEVRKARREYHSRPEVRERYREYRIRHEEKWKEELTMKRRTPLWRAKDRLPRLRRKLKGCKPGKRRENLEFLIEFYKSEVERLS